MKNTLFKLLVGFALAHGAHSLRAQSYSIDWFTIDGGGGTSTGGVYAVSGTIGQPDAGTMSGGNYTLDGGFWGIVAAMQMPGEPPLHILRTTTNTIVLSWPNPSTGFQLQQTAVLNGPATSWADVTQTPVVANGNKEVILPFAPGNHSFRLRKP